MQSSSGNCVSSSNLIRIQLLTVDVVVAVQSGWGAAIFVFFLCAKKKMAKFRPKISEKLTPF